MNIASIFSVVVLLVFVGLIGLGVTFVVMSRRRGRKHPACGHCGYDVTRSIGLERCPECGSEFSVVGISPPAGGRRVGWLVAGVLVLSTTTLLGLGVVVTAVVARQARVERAAAQAQAARAQAIAAQLAQQAAAQQRQEKQEKPTQSPTPAADTPAPAPKPDAD